jgi:putative hydrolase of the HAD superfamily
MDEMGLQELFHHHYSSHHLGMLKPDPEVFEFVLGNLNCPPDRVLFLDDNVINVVSAKQLGLKAYTVKGPEDIKQLFARLDIPVAQI